MAKTRGPRLGVRDLIVAVICITRWENGRMMMKRRGAITRVARQWRLNEVVRAQMLSALDRLTFRRERLRDSFFDILDLLRREPQLREPYFAFLRAGGNTSADFERFLSGESIGQGGRCRIERG
jgi:hypothetical protein